MAKGGVEHEDGGENGTVLQPGASEAMDNSRRAEAVTWLRRGDSGSARRAEHEQWKHGDALRAEAYGRGGRSEAVTWMGRGNESTTGRHDEKTRRPAAREGHGLRRGGT